MAIKYTEQEISALISETKLLPTNFKANIRLKPKRGHKESELDVIVDNGHQFRIILRQSSLNPLDFTIILGVLPEDTNKLFRL